MDTYQGKGLGSKTKGRWRDESRRKEKGKQLRRYTRYEIERLRDGGENSRDGEWQEIDGEMRDLKDKKWRREN